MAKILILSQHYAPEDVSGAVLGTELATGLVERGHEVDYLTCAPNYPRGKVFPGYANSFYRVERLDGVKVVRIWSYISPHKTFWRRILNYGTFSLSAFYGGLLSGKPDVLLSYSPPLPLGVSAWLLSRLWQVPWVLRVEDLYPEAAVATGVLRNPVAITLLTMLERFIYRQAKHISLISEGFRLNLLGKGVGAERITVTPVWADPDDHPQAKENRFREENRLKGKFVVLYAGTMGMTASLESVLQTASLIG